MALGLRIKVKTHRFSQCQTIMYAFHHAITRSGNATARILWIRDKRRDETTILRNIRRKTVIHVTRKSSCTEVQLAQNVHNKTAWDSIRWDHWPDEKINNVQQTRLLNDVRGQHDEFHAKKICAVERVMECNNENFVVNLITSVWRKQRDSETSEDIQVTRKSSCTELVLAQQCNKTSSSLRGPEWKCGKVAQKKRGRIGRNSLTSSWAVNSAESITYLEMASKCRQWSKTKVLRGHNVVKKRRILMKNLNCSSSGWGKLIVV